MDSEHIEAYLAGELDDKGRRQVEHALRNDSDLRASFVVQIQMESALKVLLGPGAETRQREFDEGVLARLRSEGAGDSRRFAKSVLTEIVEEREGKRPIRWPHLITTGVLSAAAWVGLLLLLKSVILNEGSQEGERGKGSVSAEEFVAHIERSEGLVWSSANPDHIRVDGWLSTGLLKIESGTALIAFNSGATALVEGPAELSIESGNRMFLKSGQLAADVPPRASGFTVNTPRINAVDIGTRFGITVEGDGDTEIHVMEGEVEVSRTSGNSVTTLVREGLALRADSRTRSELQPVPYGGDLFQLQIGREQISRPVLRYTFDESTGSIIEDSGKEPIFDVNLLAKGELGKSPLRAPGRSGGCLVFQAGETLEVGLTKEFRLENPHTIAFWVKLPPKIGRVREEKILQYGKDGLCWGVTCNLEANRGVRGALRVDCPNGYIIGSTDLADGNWHHVAYRHIGGTESDISSHLHLFIDGIPETISDYRSGKVSPGSVVSLRVGGDERTGFQGWIDDLSLFSDAISTSAIQQLND